MIVQNPLSSILDKEERKFWMGVAIIWVFLYHLIFFYPNRDIPHILRLFIEYPNKGYLGVDIFFFLSSYGLCHSFNSNTIKNFYKNRVLRIVPLYLFFCVPVIALFKNCDSVTGGLLLFIKQITGLSCIKVLSSGIEWYTPALMATYIIFPLIYRLVNKSNKLIFDLLIVFAFVMTSNFFRIYLESNFAPRFPIIIIGILTYKYQSLKKYTSLIILYTSFAIMSFGSPNNITADSLLIPIILLGLDCLPINNKIRRGISYIGKYSYEVYLAQVITTLYILGQGRCFLPSVMQIIEVVAYTIPLSIIFGVINNKSTKLLNRI